MTDQIKIGHYLLGKTIGTGGFAKVRTARHDLTNIEVAVKIINKKKMKNKSMVSKVKREIRILKFLNHPNIIKLYEVLHTTNDIFMIMELAPKGQLYDNMQSKNVSEDQARFYFKQIINGVQCIHRNHISHRDLKPQNILLDENNIIKIGDFGLSNLMKDGKLLKTSCGSSYYAAPEIVSERKYEGTSVDIWSSGVILFALITGQLPFDDHDIVMLYKKIQRTLFFIVDGVYEIPASVSPLAKDLISRMLQVDPRRRISIQQINAHPWMRTEIPIYMKLTDECVIYRDEESEIDHQVLKQIQKLNINFNDYTDEKIVKVILKRDQVSFAVAYELVKSQKQKKLYNESTVALQDEGHTIFKKIQNTVLSEFPPPLPSPVNKFTYGRSFDKNPKLLTEKIIQILKIYAIQYQVKNRQKKQQTEMRDQNQQHEYIMKKQDRFTKGVLRFTIQIYQVNRRTQTHLVDISVSQGHPLVFFQFVQRFYADLTNNYFK